MAASQQGGSVDWYHAGKWLETGGNLLMSAHVELTPTFGGKTKEVKQLQGAGLVKGKEKEKLMSIEDGELHFY